MKFDFMALWRNPVFRDYLLPIAGYIIVALIVIKIGDLIINKIFRPREKLYLDERRVNTLRTLLRSVLRYGTYFVLVFMIIDNVIGTGNIKGFLAGAGIIGVALGFGAQSLVRDVITGFFILFENQYAVGEYVTIGNLSGFVEEMELRVTKLRDWGGEVHIIPNGQVTTVTNYSRGNMRALVEISIAYEADIDRALEVLKKTAAELAAEQKEVIVEGPEVLGVVALGPSEVVIRTVAKTRPMEQWAVEREMRKRFKEAFVREGIEMPYMKRTALGPLDGGGSVPAGRKEKLKAPE